MNFGLSCVTTVQWSVLVKLSQTFSYLPTDGKVEPIRKPYLWWLGDMRRYESAVASAFGSAGHTYPSQMFVFFFFLFLDSWMKIFIRGPQWKTKNGNASFSERNRKSSVLVNRSWLTFSVPSSIWVIPLQNQNENKIRKQRKNLIWEVFEKIRLFMQMYSLMVIKKIILKILFVFLIRKNKGNK